MESDSDGDQSMVNKEGSEEVMVSDLDDEDDMIPRSTGLRRTKEGSRVEGIQIDFTGKGYGAKHEVNFMINGVKDERETKKHDVMSYMQIACNVVFMQMSADAGIKKHDEATVAAMIKEFTQLNEGAVPGNCGDPYRCINIDSGRKEESITGSKPDQGKMGR